jgi:hypothetical protein
MAKKKPNWCRGTELARTLANKIWLVGSRVKLCVQISQASDVGSIPIARSINPVDAVGFTGFGIISPSMPAQLILP